MFNDENLSYAEYKLITGVKSAYTENPQHDGQPPTGTVSLHFMCLQSNTPWEQPLGQLKLSR